MKPMNALIMSFTAGATAFAVQHYVFPAPLHAAGFVVPTNTDWRQQMIEGDPGGSVVDRRLDHLTDELGLSTDQANRLRPLLEKQHEQILALLLASPPSLTRHQFMAERQAITDRTHRQLEGMLTPDQLEVAKELQRPATA
jgi:hypothetical protein